MVRWKTDCLTKPQPWRMLIVPRDAALKPGEQEEEILLPHSLTILPLWHWSDSKGSQPPKDPGVWLVRVKLQGHREEQRMIWGSKKKNISNCLSVCFLI